MNMQNRRFITIGFSALLVVLLSNCGTSATSTRVLDLPTFAPITAIATSPSAEHQPDSTASLIFVTATEFAPETTASMSFVTATEQTPQTETQTIVPANGPTICIPPNGWRNYTVQYGDTLFSLATRTYTTVFAIQQANCREPTNTIIYSRKTVLYLPFIPPPLFTDTVAKPTAPPPGPPFVDVLPDAGPIPTTYTFMIKNFDAHEVVNIVLTTTDDLLTSVDSFQETMDKDGQYDAHWTSQPIHPEGSYFVVITGTNGIEKKQVIGEFEVKRSGPPTFYP
jgi:hypothetical protein